MGEEPGRVEEPEANPAQNVAALESEIEETRKRLGGYVSELDRRRHGMLDTPPRWRGIAVAVALLIAAAAFVLIRRMRRRR